MSPLATAKIFLKIFLMWTIFKVLLNLLQYCFCFMFWFFGHKVCGIWAPRPGMEPAPPALEGEALTTGPPGKSHSYNFAGRLMNFFSWPVEMTNHIQPIFPLLCTTSSLPLPFIGLLVNQPQYHLLLLKFSFFIKKRIP